MIPAVNWDKIFSAAINWGWAAVNLCFLPNLLLSANNEDFFFFKTLTQITVN